MFAGLSKSLLSKSSYPPALVVAGMYEVIVEKYQQAATWLHSLAELCMAVLRDSWCDEFIGNEGRTYPLHRGKWEYNLMIWFYIFTDRHGQSMEDSYDIDARK